MASGWRYDHLLRVAAGKVPGEEIFRRFGSNSDIDIGTEDVWETGGDRTAPTTAANMVFVSTSIADAPTVETSDHPDGEVG